MSKTRILVVIPVGAKYSERSKIFQEIEELLDHPHIGVPVPFDMIICYGKIYTEINNCQGMADLARLGYVPAGSQKPPPLPYSSPG